MANCYRGTYLSSLRRWCFGTWGGVRFSLVFRFHLVPLSLVPSLLDWRKGCEVDMAGTVKNMLYDLLHFVVLIEKWFAYGVHERIISLCRGSKINYGYFCFCRRQDTITTKSSAINWYQCVIFHNKWARICRLCATLVLYNSNITFIVPLEMSQSPRRTGIACSFLNEVACCSSQFVRNFYTCSDNMLGFFIWTSAARP